MAEHFRGRRFVSLVPDRVTVVATLFVGWGAVLLLAAAFNSGSSTSFYYTKWVAVLGVLLVLNGGLLYRRHWLSVPAALVALGIYFLSTLYELFVYNIPLDTFVASTAVKVLLACVLVTIARNRRSDENSS